MNSSDFTSSLNTPPQNCTPSVSPTIFINVVAYCYVLPCICCAGLLGNIANLITLFSSRLKAVSYVYLRGLGIADLLCMIFVFVFVFFEILGASRYSDILTRYNIAWYRAHLMLPLINWTVSAGILIIVALTLERYISISWPMLFRRWNSPKRAAGILVAAYIISLLFYIPMCWQNEVVQLHLNSSCQGIGHESLTVLGGATAQRWTMTDNKLLLNNNSYKAYKLTRETLLKFLPFVALAFLNLRIIFVFRKVSKRKRRLNSNSSSAGREREQRSLLFLLAGIVVLFFICNIPAAFNLLFITEAMKRKPSYMTFRAVANLLEITNHALNFYNFCLCSSDYRMTFIRKFPCVKAVQESADNLKRRLSNSFMRVHGSRKLSTNKAIKTDNCHPASTSSLRSQLVQHRGGKGQFLRRAVSSDVLLRCEPSKPNRRYRPASSSSGLSTIKDKMLSTGDKNRLSVISGPGWRNERRKYYASAESIQIFDAIPEHSSEQNLGYLSTVSVIDLNDDRKISIGKRAAVSAIDITEGDYRVLITDTSRTVETPLSAVSLAVPAGVGVKKTERETEVIVNYNPRTDTFL